MILVIAFILEILISTVIHGIITIDDSIKTVFLLIMYTVIDSVAICNDKKLKAFDNQLICGLIIRMMLLFFDQFGKSIFILPNSGIDSEVFYYSAVAYATNNNNITISTFPGLMGSLMRYIGTSRLLGQYIVVSFSMISLVCISYSILELKTDETAKNRIMWIVSLLPNFALLGSIFLRESVITMFVALSCYSFILWMKKGKGIYFFLSIVSVFIGAQYHSGILGIVAGFLVARIFYDSKKSIIRISINNIIYSVAFIISFTYIYNTYGDRLFSKIYGIDAIDDIANTTAIGGSSYAAYVGNSQSLINLIIYTPLRLLYFLFSPFPWQWRGIADIIAFVFSSLFYLYTIYKAIYQLRHTQGVQKIQLFLWLIIALAVTFVFAWGVSNTGTATRHRDKLIPIYTIILASTYIFTPENKIEAKPVSKYCK